MIEVVHDVTCTVCGCVCDDLTLQLEDDRVVSAQQACALSEPWLLQQKKSSDTVARIDGESVSFALATQKAAEILRCSHAPLVYGLSSGSTPGQRAACQLADDLGATIDSTTSNCQAASTIALQNVGQSTSSLGEVKHRSDVVVYWGCNSLATHPRHYERFVEPPGMFVPGGRVDRHVVVVDVDRTQTAEIADSFVRVEPGSDFDVLWALRSSLKGIEFHENSVGGVPRDVLLALAERLRAGRYTAIFYGSGLTKHGVPNANVEALYRLVAELNDHTRAVAHRMGAAGEAAGASNVLCWQTGFPFGVNFARGYPRYNPGEFTANELLEQGEVDAIVLVGSGGVTQLSVAAQEKLREIPIIELDGQNCKSTLAPEVHFTTATSGIHCSGTAYRMDDVPIPMRAVLNGSAPSVDAVLKAIGAALAATS